ncbi:putative polysaccharide biosynthesis protein [Gorgonomyces haynaldii]|nr:putative polysaccharide biosynthesis protein [Gorgonomyces haynaldii]
MVKAYGVDSENVENNPDIEKQWAVKAFHHAETFFNILKKIPGSKLKLTPIDEEIHTAFRKEFPDLNIAEIDEMKEFKNEASKTKWRNFMMPFEKRIQDFNFGTMLRNRPHEDYAQDNAFFVTRFQFYCIEVARNREGLNDVIFQSQQQ